MESEYSNTEDLQMPEATLYEPQLGETHMPEYDRQPSDWPMPQLTPGSFGQFDILDWHPTYRSCQKHFLDHAQYDSSVQAVASLINISLPHQWTSKPICSFNAEHEPTDEVRKPQVDNDEVLSDASQSGTNNAVPRSQNSQSHPSYLTISTLHYNFVSLVPFLRRLIVTGFDRDSVLHGFFGDDWRKGIGPLHECERRNYLFAAKSGGWATVKGQYDMSPQETVPFLQPPQNVQLVEIENAEKLWSQWLAVEDWVVGPRAPASTEDYVRSSQGSH